jgi:hypothetical protein
MEKVGSALRETMGAFLAFVSLYFSRRGLPFSGSPQLSTAAMRAFDCSWNGRRFLPELSWQYFPTKGAVDYFSTHLFHLQPNLPSRSPQNSPTKKKGERSCEETRWRCLVQFRKSKSHPPHLQTRIFLIRLVDSLHFIES